MIVPSRRFSGRYATAAWAVVPFLAVNALVRAGLVVFDGDPANFAPLRLVAIMATGLAYDLAVAAWLAVPFLLLAATLPAGPIGRRLHGVLASVLVVALAAVAAFGAVAEFLFWNEFSSRFNFIAVDYLVYTREVLGNIRQSYPVGPILGGLAAVVCAFALAVRKPLWRTATAGAGRLRHRLVAVLAAVVLPAAALQVGDGLREALPTPSARELAGDGTYEFVRAFRNNDLDYRTFYKTIDDALAVEDLREEFTEAHSAAAFTFGTHPLERTVASAAREMHLNVVLVSIESLGADYVGALGGRPGLTPNLDRLAAEGLAFTHVYATGLRTVRGLEALTLSIPPTPGHAIPMRPNNRGLQSVGAVFREHGYESLFVYGGYGQFDNMKDFFGGNGYTVVDRTAIPRDAITHETIWGVADEDLFGQALREMDARAEGGKPVFMHVMTTSNHRPFTYPAGRIDIAPGTGRDGAVKYTDYAIGRFVEQARSRPWFADTVFVFVADHTSHGRGRTDLPPENFHIPLIIWSPSHVAPAVVDAVASQIDVAPTVLSLLGFHYTSRFFGQDILTEGRHHARAFIANYLTVGYIEDGVVVELGPRKRARVVDAASGSAVHSDGHIEHLIEEAVAHYQVASDVVRKLTLSAAGRPR